MKVICSFGLQYELGSYFSYIDKETDLNTSRRRNNTIQLIYYDT